MLEHAGYDAGMGPNEQRHLSPLEATWPDNISRERRLLREHPEWRISRHKPDGWPAEPVTFEATDGAVTIRSDDLGALLNLVERAMQDGD
jgi:hypothetical protein